MPFRFPLILQADSSDCGVACLAMVARYYGAVIDYDALRQRCQVSRIGISMYTINVEAQKLGFDTNAVQLSFNTLRTVAQLPCIVYWNKEHFVVVRRITKRKVLVADPGMGFLAYSHVEFQKHWCCEGEDGFALLMTLWILKFGGTAQKKIPALRQLLQ